MGDAGTPSSVWGKVPHTGSPNKRGKFVKAKGRRISFDFYKRRLFYTKDGEYK
jgi:hypothetical protein